MQKSKFKIFSFFRQRRISLWLNFFAVVFSFSLLAFRFASPALAQGTCRANNVGIPPNIECMLVDNRCEEGRSARVLKTATGCDCVCSLIPGYEGIEEFMDFKFKRATIGDVFSDALKYVYIFAGLGVFIYLIYGGFHLMISGGDPAAIAEAKGKITNAIIGFIIIFASYWLIQIIEVIFGMKIL